jgi:Fe-S cluster biogenesis protein NfuA
MGSGDYGTRFGRPRRGLQLEYEEWIERERRVRTRILMSSPVIAKDGLCRTCQDCGEILLCHEGTCPNCNSGRITSQRIDDALDAARIRCRFRFEHLT